MYNKMKNIGVIRVLINKINCIKIMLNFLYLRRHAGTPPNTPHLAPIGHGQVRQFPVQAKYKGIT